MSTIPVWTPEGEEHSLPVPQAYSPEDLVEVTADRLGEYTGNAPILVAASQYPSFAQAMETASLPNPPYAVVYQDEEGTEASFEYAQETVDRWEDVQQHIEAPLLIHMEMLAQSLPQRVILKLPEEIDSLSVEEKLSDLGWPENELQALKDETDYQERFQKAVNEERALYWATNTATMMDFMDLMLGVIAPANEKHMQPHMRSPRKQAMLKSLINRNADRLFAYSVPTKDEAEDESLLHLRERAVKNLLLLALIANQRSRNRFRNRSAGAAMTQSQQGVNENLSDLLEDLEEGRPVVKQGKIEDGIPVEYVVESAERQGTEGFIIRDIRVGYSPVPLFYVEVVSEQETLYSWLSKEGQVFISNEIGSEVAADLPEEDDIRLVTKAIFPISEESQPAWE